MADLITGYFDKYGKAKGNIVRWKMHFRKYCPLPSQQECSVMENFDYLERSGLLAVGKYDILENIFRFVDDRALRNIKDASQMINAIKSTSRDARGMYRYTISSTCTKIVKTVYLHDSKCNIKNVLRKDGLIVKSVFNPFEIMLIKKTCSYIYI